MKDLLLQKIAETPDLPPLPDIVSKIDVKLRDPDAHINDIAKIIEIDPALSGRILRISRSVMYGSRSEIKNLSSAIMRLGLIEIRKVVYSLELTKLFGNSTVFDQKKYWRHSLAVALITRSLAKKVDASLRERDSAYLAGLMHDIGLMIFDHFIPEKYSEFLANLKEHDSFLSGAERKVFGIDHGELGAAFMKKWWPVDNEVIDAVHYHHYPFEGKPESKRISLLIHVANRLCEVAGIDLGIGVVTDIFQKKSFVELGLNPADAQVLLAEAKENVSQIEEFLLSSDPDY